jgi:hypothetical protein
MNKPHLDRILFLDIDGVILPENYLMSDVNRALFDDFQKNRLLHRIAYQLTFDPQCMSYLKQIIQRTQCKLVVISTWRRLMSSEIIDLLIDTKEFDPAWFHDVPVCELRMTSEKCHDISSWIGYEYDENKVYDYLILDDDHRISSGDNEFSERHIIPAYETGLTEVEFNAILKKWR